MQQTQGKKGFEAWRATPRRYEQRNMSDKQSAYVSLISNTSERDTAEDMEQLDDILRTFINEKNKFENRCGLLRDEEKMLAVKKLILRACCNSPDSQKQED